MMTAYGQVAQKAGPILLKLSPHRLTRPNLVRVCAEVIWFCMPQKKLVENSLPREPTNNNPTRFTSISTIYPE